MNYDISLNSLHIVTPIILRLENQTQTPNSKPIETPFI